MLATYATVESMLSAECGSENYYVPRSGTPTQSLCLLADAGNDLASRRGTCTTTDWGLCSQEELYNITSSCESSGGSEGGEMSHVFDQGNAASVELICDCCRGLGHIKRVCPSNRGRFCSLQYAIGVLSAKHASMDGAPRRPPPRGQRAPFTNKPQGFQPHVFQRGGRGGFSWWIPRPWPRRPRFLC